MLDPPGKLRVVGIFTTDVDETLRGKRQTDIAGELKVGFAFVPLTDLDLELTPFSPDYS